MYPTVPDFPPFRGEANVNLMLGGDWYDGTLNKIEDYLNTLGKYIDGEFSEVFEALEAHEKQITANTNNIAELRADVNTLRADVDDNTSDIAELRSDVDTNSADIATLDTGMTIVKSTIERIKTDIATIKSDIEALKLRPVFEPADNDDVLTAGMLSHTSDAGGTYVDKNGILYLDKKDTVL